MAASTAVSAPGPHPTSRTRWPGDADYGLRGFVIADPDGNRIDVGQQLPSSPGDK